MNRGCDRVMQALAAQGVSDIFALSGNQIMPLFDASLEAGIRLYHTRHEAAAVYMAEGYAQLTGGVGVALVTAGAGLGNAMGPLLTARASDTPLLLLSGDSPVSRDGQGAFQEMDQVGLSQSVTKWSVRVTDPDALAATIHKALSLAASGRPGPVHVSLPADVLTAASAGGAQPGAPVASAPDTEDLAAWLAGGKTPVIVLGPALNATRKPGLAQRLALATGAAVFATESPRGAKDPSLGAVAELLAEADRVLLLGKPLDFTLQFGAVAPSADWALVNADPAELDRAQGNVGARLALGLEAEPGAMAEALCKLASGPAWPSDWQQRVSAAIAKRTPIVATQNPIHPSGLCAAVQGVLDGLERPILVCDGGEFGQWAQAGLSASRRVINGVSGAIGGGLCYAMAARAADPQATVIALMGDGTLGFHVSEFETAVREDLPFVAIIGNDLRWNAEHQIQLRSFGADRLHGCALSAARYDQAVAAWGGFGALVEDLASLPSVLEQAIASRKPACINVMIDGQPAPSVSLG